MLRYKIIIEFDGTNLIGWQENKDGDSVQSLIQNAIYKFSNQEVKVHSAGRTDSGVHALGLVAHFDLSSNHDANTVMRALNFYLSKMPVVILSCVLVSDDFHARFSCLRRHYKYIILNRQSPAVLDKDRVWWVPQKLDIKKMTSVAKDLIGTHDFTSFRASECQAQSPIKTLDTAVIKSGKDFGANEVQGDYIIIEFSAKSFLHHQVRNMVGTLVEIGLGKTYDINEVFDKKDRSQAGPTAPACGLYFISGDYAKSD